MHVAVDASDLTSEKLDGTTVYARELLPRLLRVLAEHGHRVTVFLPRPPLPELSLPADVEQTIIPGRRFWTQTVLSRALFAVRPDVLFLPIQTVPLYRPAGVRVVATVHDLDFFDFPRMYTWKNRLLLRWFTRVVARNAHRLIAVSQTTKDAILGRYTRSSEDITVVHHGYDSSLFRLPASEDQRAGAVRDLRGRYDLPERYILFVGALQPRKNISGLVTAYEKLVREGREEQLVLVSGHGWQEGPLLETLEASSVRDRIHLIRGLPRTDLPGMYWGASAFVLPSFAEGFGMPVLEAMACGTPVVVSRGTALEEVAGGAAELVDPTDPTAVAAGIGRVLTDATYREQLRTRGTEHARQFSWDRCAKETAAVIEQSGR